LGRERRGCAPLGRRPGSLGLGKETRAAGKIETPGSGGKGVCESVLSRKIRRPRRFTEERVRWGKSGASQALGQAASDYHRKRESTLVEKTGEKRFPFWGKKWKPEMVFCLRVTSVPIRTPPQDLSSQNK